MRHALFHRTAHAPWSVTFVLALGACASSPDGHSERVGEWRDLDRARREAEPDPITADTAVEELVAQALHANPDLHAGFERWQAALERVPQASKLPEPRLTFAAYLAEVETRVGPMQGRIGIAQPLPWFGKRDALSEVAFRAAEAAREDVEAKRIDIAAAVLDAWYEATWLERAIAISSAHRELLVRWEDVALNRYSTGIGSHADVIRAQVELGDLDNRILSLEDLRRPIRARLNTMLDRPAGAFLPIPTDTFPDPPALDEERIEAELALTSPRLRAIAQRIEAAAYRVELARKQFYPDLVVGADYTFIGDAENPGVSGSGDDAFALTLGFELPIWRSSYHAGLREAEALQRAARLDFDSESNQIVLNLELALYRLRDGDRRVGLLRDSLIPKGEESVASLDTAYRSGDLGFLDMVDAERMLLEFQLQSARAEADRAQAVAEIQRITGVMLLPRS